MTPRLSPSHIRTTPLRKFLFGSAYYPEHWDEATRASDPALFSAAGWNVVRMGEFGWDRMEPEPNRFDFSLFDEMVARFARVGIRTIFCTPTAAPPRWLTREHPEVLRVDADGRVQLHGSRQHASHFSPIFRDRSRRITQALAEHFAGNQNIIGWQTDNELHCHFREDYSDAAVAAWIEWLSDRYGGDIQNLNKAWGTAFWAQTFDRFTDIPLPRAGRPTYPNPSQMLDYQRFLSAGATLFQQEQIDLLRAADSRWFVTHNGCFPSIDYRGDFVRDLDFLSFDSYPLFETDAERRAARHAFDLDQVRSYAGHFLVMEQQSGPGGQGDFLHDTPEPGEIRRMAWTSIARGGDGMLFFRERSCRFGAEEYWVGVLDHDNVPRRRYREAAYLGEELARIGSHLLGTRVRVDVGIAGADFAAEHGHVSLSHGLPGPRAMAEAVHGVFFRAGYAVGVVHPSDELARLHLYIIPHLALFDPSWVPALEAFVSAGGTLLIGARTGCKDLNNRVIAETLPGALRHLVGATVEEYGRQNRPDQRPLYLRFVDESAELKTSLWYEVLQPDSSAGTTAEAMWSTRHLQGSAAITRRKLGRGQVIYVGTYLTREFVESLLPALERWSALPSRLSTVSGVEVVERFRPDGQHLRVFINHNGKPSEVPMPDGGGHELLRDRLIAPKTIQTLAANDVMVVAHAG